LASTEKCSEDCNKEECSECPVATGKSACCSKEKQADAKAEEVKLAADTEEEDSDG
jgi:hypothetical protein